MNRHLYITYGDVCWAGLVCTMDSIFCDAACSSRRDLVGVWNEERCFFDDLSMRFEKLALRVLFDLNILKRGMAMDLIAKTGVRMIKNGRRLE
jgi:hypothetical protein